MSPTGDKVAAYNCSRSSSILLEDFALLGGWSTKDLRWFCPFPLQVPTSRARANRVTEIQMRMIENPVNWLSSSVSVKGQWQEYFISLTEKQNTSSTTYLPELLVSAIFNLWIVSNVNSLSISFPPTTSFSLEPSIVLTPVDDFTYKFNWKTYEASIRILLISSCMQCLPPSVVNGQKLHIPKIIINASQHYPRIGKRNWYSSERI